MNIQPKCVATAIGSLPHSNADQALDVIFGSIPDAPIWPQLPKLGLREQMEIQYSEGLPCVVIDEEKNRMYFNTSGDYSEELAKFYEGYITASESSDYSVASISPKFSAGIPALEKRLKTLSKKLLFIKTQTTGPLSFALTSVDQNKRAIYYNEEFMDVIVKSLAMKCRWQIKKFKPYAENIICFVDEPILSAFGSSTYVSVQRDDVIGKLGEVIQAIHDEGAFSGAHCCGNTEWSILVDAGVMIINFDAFQFGETVALYPAHIRKHLVENKNALAWGIVPTSVAIREVNAAQLVEKFEKLADNLSKKSGVDKAIIAAQAIITPSCGTGSMSLQDADRVFATLRETSQALQERYRF
ncbi:MAG: hypothetical protein V1899_02020 [Planctomycetota bacterium]